MSSQTRSKPSNSRVRVGWRHDTGGTEHQYRHVAASSGVLLSNRALIDGCLRGSN
jgi:hypothetical protein